MTDYTLPLTSGVALGSIDYFVNKRNGYKTSLKMAGVQAGVVLGSEIGLNSISGSIKKRMPTFLADYTGDILSALIFATISIFVFEKSFKMEDFFKDAFMSIISIEIGRGIEAPIKPYLPKLITGN